MGAQRPGSKSQLLDPVVILTCTHQFLLPSIILVSQDCSWKLNGMLYMILPAQSTEWRAWQRLHSFRTEWWEQFLSVETQRVLASNSQGGWKGQDVGRLLTHGEGLTPYPRVAQMLSERRDDFPFWGRTKRPSDKRETGRNARWGETIPFTLPQRSGPI